MILDTLNEISDRRMGNASSLVYGNVKALGRDATSYTVRLKAGTLLYGIHGPESIKVGALVVLSVSPGKVKRYTIIGKAGGASNTTPTKVRV